MITTNYSCRNFAANLAHRCALNDIYVIGGPERQAERPAVRTLSQGRVTIGDNHAP
jgi:hypothetical protein